MTFNIEISEDKFAILSKIAEEAGVEPKVIIEDFISQLEIAQDSEIVYLLNKLAEESQKHPANLLEEIITKEDGERHVEWDRTSREFKRVRCGRSDCFESVEFKREGH